MKFQVVCVIIAFCALKLVASNLNIKEVCDIEGSGAEDCPIDTYCCKQSKCNSAYED